MNQGDKGKCYVKIGLACKLHFSSYAVHSSTVGEKTFGNGIRWCDVKNDSVEFTVQCYKMYTFLEVECPKKDAQTIYTQIFFT